MATDRSESEKKRKRKMAELTQKQIDILARRAWTMPAEQFEILPARVVKRSIELDLLENEKTESVYYDGVAILSERW